MTINEQLKQERKNRKLTHIEISTQTGISISMLRMIEQGLTPGTDVEIELKKWLTPVTA